MTLASVSCAKKEGRPTLSIKYGESLETRDFGTRRYQRCAKGNRKYRKERIHGFPPSRLTLHPRAEMRLVLRENVGRYRTLNESRFLEMVRRLKAQGVALQVVRKERLSVATPPAARESSRDLFSSHINYESSQLITSELV